MTPASTVPAVLLYYTAPDAAEPVRVETRSTPLMFSSQQEAVAALKAGKPALVFEDDAPAVLAALSAERVTS